MLWGYTSGGKAACGHRLTMLIPRQCVVENMHVMGRQRRQEVRAWSWETSDRLNSWLASTLAASASSPGLKRQMISSISH